MKRLNSRTLIAGCRDGAVATLWPPSRLRSPALPMHTLTLITIHDTLRTHTHSHTHILHSPHPALTLEILAAQAQAQAHVQTVQTRTTCATEPSSNLPIGAWASAASAASALLAAAPVPTTAASSSSHLSRSCLAGWENPRLQTVSCQAIRLSTLSLRHWTSGFQNSD